MMVFWIVAALLIIAALMFLLPPLIQKSDKKDVLDRDALNTTIFKDQMAELENDLAAGLLSQEQYETACHDLERSFLQEAEQQSDDNLAVQTDRVVGRATAVVVAVVIPVLAVGLYGLLGSGKAGLHPEDATPNIQAKGHKGTLEQQVRKLQDHLQTNPDDTDSWVMLARSYYFMKQYASASDAFAKASALLQDSNPDILADYADALAMASGRNMAGQPFELVKKALAIQPFNQKALWLAGTASFQAQDYKTTLDYWKRLLQLFPKDSDNYNQMKKNVAEVEHKLGMPIDVDLSENSSSTTSPASSSATTGPKVTGTVRLADALALDASIDDTLFVFARAASGPRMPLAIIRKKVKDLPLKFTLDDSMAMNPAMKLSNFPKVVIGARISKSGNAMPQSGDMQGTFGPVAVKDAKGIEVVINQTIQ
jgi:cytochrome c-type biogenesis protein CcmH